MTSQFVDERGTTGLFGIHHAGREEKMTGGAEERA